MKMLGMVGGLGPESTVDYYQQLIAAYQARKRDGSFPAILINSVNAKPLLDAMQAYRLAEITELLLGAVEKLARGGADFALIAANTPHIVFDELSPQSPIPLLSIVECTCQAAKAMGLNKVGLFGTRYTMQGSFYPKVFSREGIELIAPEAADQEYLHEKYMGELFKGLFLPETREGLLAIVERMQAKSGIEGVILGGTELSLILRDQERRGVPFLNTTRIHVEAAINRMLE